jgi:hypothetical protein
MTKTAALIFGIAFLLAGILGFVPAAAPHGMLLGLLHVNTAHNLVHLLTGAIGIWAGTRSVQASRVFFQTLGVVYLVVALAGFYYGDEPIFGVVANNMADAWFHLVVATVSLYFGFATRPVTSYAAAR